MAFFRYKTPNDTSPIGKYKIYLCAHKDEVLSWVDRVSKLLFSIHSNCCLWYYDESFLSENLTQENVYENLSEMRLFVVPVTQKFLNENKIALDDHLKFARQINTPVLFLLQDDNLVDQFNEVFGKLHFIKESDAEYEKKITRFIAFLLADDKLLKKVDKAFDSKIFLSYRKHDKAYAKAIINLIHKYNKNAAVWFDDYLLPGEKFDIKIKAALKNSDFMAMVITPNVLNTPNYVQKEEYPYAKEKLHKEVLPLEVVETDKKELSHVLENIGPCIKVTDEDALVKALNKKFSKYKRTSKLTPDEKEYLIGIAYLVGINIERNPQLGFEMIKNAAEAGNYEAMNKLYQMYRVGDFVDEDYKEAIKWKLRNVRSLCYLRYNSKYSYQRKKYGLEFINSSLELLEYKQYLTSYDFGRIDTDFIYSDILPLPETFEEKMYADNLSTIEGNLDLFSAFLCDRYSGEDVLLARAKCHYRCAYDMNEYNDPSLYDTTLECYDETISLLGDVSNKSLEVKLLAADVYIGKAQVVFRNAGSAIKFTQIPAEIITSKTGMKNWNPTASKKEMLAEIKESLKYAYNAEGLLRDALDILVEAYVKNNKSLDILRQMYKAQNMSANIYLHIYRYTGQEDNKKRYAEHVRSSIETIEELVDRNETQMNFMDLAESYENLLWNATSGERFKSLLDNKELIETYEKLVNVEKTLEERWNISRKRSQMYKIINNKDLIRFL